MHNIMSIMISIICFSWCSCLQEAVTTASVCESVFAYYQVVIVGLDCSSDIQQIKLKGDILSLVTGSLRKKRLMCWMLIVHIISVLKVTGKVCRVCGCRAIWGAVIYCITEEMTVQRCFVLLFITSVFFLPLQCIFPHLNYCLMLRFTKPLCLYMPLCSKVNMWIKLKHDGINPLA